MLRLRRTFESGQMAAARATSRGANRPFSSRSLPVSSCSSASVELLSSCPSFAPRFFPPKKREPVIEVVARATGRGADSSVGPGAPRQRPARHETRRRPGADPAPCAQAVRLGGVERHHRARQPGTVPVASPVLTGGHRSVATSAMQRRTRRSARGRRPNRLLAAARSRASRRFPHAVARYLSIARRCATRCDNQQGDPDCNHV